jgi:hypothetical protein
VLFERGCFVHAIDEQIAPAHAAQLVRILSAAGLISIWSSLALSRTDLENAVQTAQNGAFLAVDDVIASGSDAAAICELLEHRGILLFPN